jgi:hypothetical protein
MSTLAVWAGFASHRSQISMEAGGIRLETRTNPGQTNGRVAPSENCEVKTRSTLRQEVADGSVELGTDCDFVSVVGFTVWQFHEIGMR